MKSSFKFISSHRVSTIILAASLLIEPLHAQVQVSPDTAKFIPPAALHQLPPAYPVPYGIPAVTDITDKLIRIKEYLYSATPVILMNKLTGQEITDLSIPDTNTIIQRGELPIVSYEWGVTYGAMIRAGNITGDTGFINYVKERLDFISRMSSYYATAEQKFPQWHAPLRSVLHPKSLDDAGSMCAAMIKAQLAGINLSLRPLIDNYSDYVCNEEFRLNDGCFARRGPYPHTLWLDDLYMSVPALAQMGKLTGDEKYYDDAVNQILRFSLRMFNQEKKIYMHGWAEEMDTHPAFYWARANGWAIMAMIELLDVLPENHTGRESVVLILQSHLQGLAACQSGTGLWHQLLDRNDSYLETSASAIFTYCIARSVNKGYVDAKVYGPIALLAWNAVTTRINSEGQVEGTCVGTGMGFDPAFYFYRPQSKFAAHGYGPVILAGCEIIQLLKSEKYAVEGGSVKFYD